MSLATYTNECMFFVGGNKAKSLNPTGQSLAGGCTKEWWDTWIADRILLGDTEVQAKEYAMDKLMGVDGQPKATTAVTHGEVTSGSHTGKTRLYSSGGSFFYAEAGMLLYHPNTGYPMSGAGMYRILEVDPVSYAWVTIDQTWSSMFTTNDGDSVRVGGAWADPAILIESYISATTYSQRVNVNKDLAPTAQWDLSGWIGYVDNNSWTIVEGFHRTPGDIFEPDGVYYQTLKSIHEDGAGADNLVNVDCDGVGAVNFADPTNSHNIIFRGFKFYNHATPSNFWEGGATNFGSIVFDHCFKEPTFSNYVGLGEGVLYIDSFLGAEVGSSANAISNLAGGFVMAINCIIKPADSNVGASMAGFAVFVNCLTDANGSTVPLQAMGSSAVVLSLNNTFIDYDSTTLGTIRANNDGIAFSINDLIQNSIQAASAYSVSINGGSHYTRNVNAYSDTGALTEVIKIQATSTNKKHEIVNLLEVDPALDINHEPLTESVRRGGLHDIQDDSTSLGAIQGMNTAILNTAVQAGLTAQGYTTARSPKLDNLDAAVSAVDTSACKLASDGLDSVVVAEPTGSPSGWSFAQCLRWLIMRFFNKHTSDNFSGISVHKGDGSVSTQQAVTEISGVKSVGKVTL